MMKYQTQKLIPIAESFLGTPFKHQGRRKHIGIDCIGLIVEIVRELELRTYNENGKHVPLSSYDTTNYSRGPNPTELQNALDTLLQPILVDEIRISDVLLFKFVKWPQHVGIVTDIASDIIFIHASEPVGKVIKSRLDQRWQRYLIKQYRFFESAFVQDKCIEAG